LVNGIIGIIGYNLGVYDTLNPSISLPWIMPAFIGPILTIGIKGVIAVVIAICINGLIYLPFFLKADKLALAEEQALEAEVMAEKVTEAV
jgi:PTS system cellobiose-specific IIC component